MKFLKFFYINYIVARRNWTRNFFRRESYLYLSPERAGRRAEFNRRGGVVGTGILYLVYMLMMAMIAGGTIGGLIAYFGKGYDFRQSEANLLLSRVEECFIRENFFADEFGEGVTGFYEKCRLSEDVLSENHLVYVKRKSDNKEFFVGVYDYAIRCGMDARKKNLNLPLCAEGKIGDYYFLAGSSQNSRRTAA